MTARCQGATLQVATTCTPCNHAPGSPEVALHTPTQGGVQHRQVPKGSRNVAPPQTSVIPRKHAERVQTDTCTPVSALRQGIQP